MGRKGGQKREKKGGKGGGEGRKGKRREKTLDLLPLEKKFLVLLLLRGEQEEGK